MGMPANAALVTLLALVLGAPATGADKIFITIGAGALKGIYYPVGLALCGLVNRGEEHHGVLCTVEVTAGSIYNLNSVRSGELEMGMVQSDWQYHAYHGTSEFESEAPFDDLRSVFSVHPEPFTVVVRADAGIKHIGDLIGKRVNLGNPGSGQRATMEVVMEALGWTSRDFASVSELALLEQGEALCENEVDAVVFTGGHPSDSILGATTACDSIIIEVSGSEIDELVADNPYYRYAVIPADTYRGNPNSTVTFGVEATLVSSTRTDADVVYAVVKSVFENFDEFRSMHPAITGLEKAQMVPDRLSAPVHPGAAKYYREVGLM